MAKWSRICVETSDAERRGSGAGPARSARTVAWNHLLAPICEFLKSPTLLFNVADLLAAGIKLDPVMARLTQ